jgi:hypothetical protein
MVCIGAEMVIKNGTFEINADDIARSQMKEKRKINPLMRKRFFR